jgi:hypothetical protein
VGKTVEINGFIAYKPDGLKAGFYMQNSQDGKNNSIMNRSI